MTMDGHCGYAAVSPTNPMTDTWCQAAKYFGNNKKAHDAEHRGRPGAGAPQQHR
jgi:hypothetical protein